MEFYASKKLVCLIPQNLGLGGPASFQARLISGLTRMGIEVTHDPLDPAVSAILVNGGTKDLALLHQAKRRGVRIVQRLNGMNWVHRKRFTGIRHFVRAEWGNWVLGQIRNHLADAVVYQSQFSQRWWNDAGGETAASGTVIYNGVDLSVFTPEGPEFPLSESYTVLVVEGHHGGGYDQGLASAVQLVELLNHRMDKMVRLVVAGDVPPRLKEQFKGVEFPIQWLGVVKRDQIPAFDRSAHMLFSTDVNAACPNAVIEALACGLPVISFDTGSLPELVTPQAGCIAPYGGNVWNLDKPDIHALADCARQVLEAQDDYRKGARARAEQAFSLDEMTKRYVNVLLDL